MKTSHILTICLLTLSLQLGHTCTAQSTSWTPTNISELAAKAFHDRYGDVADQAQAAQAADKQSFGTKVQGWEGKYLEGDVHLSWKVRQETDIEHYRIDRTTDGVNFTFVGTVESKGGMPSLQAYSHVDDNPVNGYNYYCLSSQDSEENVICWGFVEVLVQEKPQIQVWPNPGSRMSMVVELNYLQDALVNWQVRDLTGRVLVQNQAAEVEDGSLRLNIAQYDALSAGTYVLNISGPATAFCERIVVRE